MKSLAASLVALVFALAATAAEEEADTTSMPPTPPADEPSGLTWGQVWGLLAGIGAGAGGGAWLTRRTIARIDPQPLEVTASKEYATRQELKELRSYVEDEMSKQASRIDLLLGSTGEIKGQLIVMNQNQEKILTLLLSNAKN